MRLMPAPIAQRIADRIADSRERELWLSVQSLGDELDASNDGAHGRPHWQIDRDYGRANRALTAYRQEMNR